MLVAVAVVDNDDDYVVAMAVVVVVSVGEVMMTSMVIGCLSVPLFASSASPFRPLPNTLSMSLASHPYPYLCSY